MAQRIINERRREAVHLAIRDWCDRHGGQSAGARAAGRQGVEVTQQALGDAAKGKKIGEKMADVAAALYGTTHDGLVRMFVTEAGKEPMPLRDVPGWARAKAEAMATLGGKVDAHVWRAIDDIVVPVRCKPATGEMVKGIARWLDEFAQVSGVREKASESADL